MRRVYKNLCPATISASIMAAKSSLKNVESDNNKILYETLLEYFLKRNGPYFLNTPRASVHIAYCLQICSFSFTCKDYDGYISPRCRILAEKTMELQSPLLRSQEPATGSNPKPVTLSSHYSILMLPFHLCSQLPSGLLPSGFSTQNFVVRSYPLHELPA